MCFKYYHLLCYKAAHRKQEYKHKNIKHTSDILTNKITNKYKTHKNAHRFFFQFLVEF